MIVGSLAVCSSNRSDRRRPLSRKRAPLRLDCHHKSEIAADKEEVDGNTIGELRHPFHLAFPTHDITASREFYLG